MGADWQIRALTFMSIQIEKLSQSLGYNFKNTELLEEALSHRSIGNRSNERMEFLGDSVLNFVIASSLFDQYPDCDEGELSRLRAYLVNGEILAELAKELHVGEYLYLGVGEVKSGGYRRTSILSDALEALIGAIYLDSGIEICKKQILKWYDKRLLKLPLIAPKDPKTRLQELLQARKLSLPAYTIISTKGAAHAQIFYIECKVEGVDSITVGSGSTKRKAEQNAAELLLKELIDKE